MGWQFYRISYTLIQGLINCLFPSNWEGWIVLLEEPYERRKNLQKYWEEDTKKGLKKDLNNNLSNFYGVQLAHWPLVFLLWSKIVVVMRFLLVILFGVVAVVMVVVVVFILLLLCKKFNRTLTFPSISSTLWSLTQERVAIPAILSFDTDWAYRMVHVQKGLLHLVK